MITRETTLRVARPTDHFDEAVRFYTEGVGLTELGSFEDHEGFDGVMLGLAGASYHLEFTRKRGHMAGRAPTVGLGRGSVGNWVLRASEQPNRRLQRIGISVSLIDNLPYSAVVSRPLKRSVGLPWFSVCYRGK